MTNTNKAAEEGGLPALPDANDIKGPNGWIDFYTDTQMREYALEAIAADRASRQVANKAEVEPVDYEISDNSETWNEAAKQVRKKLQGAIDITTPPATTGCAEARHTGGASATPTGASTAFMPTVLADERIAEIWRGLDHIDRMNLPGPFARAIEREVAAQASQVAVPEDTARLNWIIEHPCAKLDQTGTRGGWTVWNRVNGQTYAAGKRTARAALDEAMNAAPSPAKESK